MTVYENSVSISNLMQNGYRIAETPYARLKLEYRLINHIDKDTNPQRNIIQKQDEQDKGTVAYGKSLKLLYWK